MSYPELSFSDVHTGWSEGAASHIAAAATPAEVIRRFTAEAGDLSGAPFSQVWGALATTAAEDLGAARTVEPHLDALTILHQAPDDTGPRPPEDSTWGVFAAEASGTRLEATPAEDGTWTLTGVKPWCSLAGQLSHAVVTAHAPGGRRAFAVVLHSPGRTQLDPGIRLHEDPWASRGLREIPSGAVEFTAVPATPIGPTDWYLSRPGFAWGGIGVAACWYGGAVGLARQAWESCSAKLAKRAAPPEESTVVDSLIGRIDAELLSARTALREAALVADGEKSLDEVIGQPDSSPWTLALRTRNVVLHSASLVQSLSREIAGPALLTGSERFAKADADLTVYLSQHHGARDDAALGRALLSSGVSPW